MPDSTQQVFRFVAGALWDLLARWRMRLAGVLRELGPEPGFQDTALDGRLLQPLPLVPIGSDDAALAALVAAIARILPDGTVAPAVRLHGFDPGAGQPRGIALVLTTPPPATAVVAALTGDGASGIAIEIAAAGSGAFGPTTLPLLGPWSIDIAGDLAGGGRLQFPRDAPGRILGAGAPVRVAWTLRRNGAGPTVALGPDGGPQLRLSSVSFTASAAIGPGGAPVPSFALSLPHADLSLAPDVLRPLVGSRLAMPVDIDLTADPEHGVAFRGGGLRASIPTNVQLPAVRIGAVETGVAIAGDDVRLSFGVAVTGGLFGLPLELTVDGLGASFPVAVGRQGLGIAASDVRPALPSGIGVDLSLPLLAGGGFLAVTGPGSYGGALDLDLLALTIDAFGLLQLPVEGGPLSFVAMLSVAFPFPGIQIGFGFSLNAVGGVVAVNRRLDQGALQSAITDGSADLLLFPVDPASHGPAIVSALSHVFPAAEDHLVVGPMLQIGWGGRILTIDAAVVIDLPSPVQFAVIGRLKLALPDPAAPLMLLQATIVGAFELSPQPALAVRASLHGSEMVGIPLHGDLFLLASGGDDPEFVLSVGGFHPRFARPAGVPALERIQLDLTPPGFPGLRSDAYVAITSNTVQLGAHLELCDEIAGCGVHGNFDFDALFQWDPTFAFAVRCSAGIAVRVLGETLMGISFDLVLEGPAPWHAHGTGSIDLFLFSASLDFDVSWGSAPPPLPTAPDLAPVLARALSEPSAWIGVPPRDDRSFVALSAAATKLTSSGHRLHPLGSVTVRERAVPFGIQISRYQNRPIPPQTWKILAAIPALGAATTDEFPPGEFLSLTEDQRLSRPAFERFVSGAQLTPDGEVHQDLRSVDTSFEVLLIPDIPVGDPFAFVFADVEKLMVIRDPHLLPSLWMPLTATPVVVLPAPPVALATTSTLDLVPLEAAPAGFTALQQAAISQFGAIGPAAGVQVVEQWELSP